MVSALGRFLCLALAPALVLVLMTPALSRAAEAEAQSAKGEAPAMGRRAAPADLPRPKRLVVARGDHAYPPYEFLDMDGQPAGWNVDLIRAVAEVAGFQVEIILGPWYEVRHDLEHGKIDMLLGMVFSEERDRKADFSIPHQELAYGVFTRRDSDLTNVMSLRDLTGREAMVQAGGIMHDVLAGMDMRVILADSPADALRRLSDGRHDAAVLNLYQGLYLSKNLGMDNVIPAGRNVYKQDYGFAVTQGDAELLDELNTGLAIIKENGRYRELYEKWFGVYEKERGAADIWLTYLLYIALPLAAAGVAVLFWNTVLRRQVALKTRKLERELADRMKAEQALRENEDIFASIMNNLPALAFVKDAEGRYVYLNKGFTTLYGDRPEKRMGRTDYELWPEDMAREMAENDRKVLETGMPCTVLETSLVEGEKHYHYVSKFPIMKNGKAMAIGGIAVDVTEQKRSEAEYKTIFENTGTAVAIFEEDTTISLVNQRLVEMSGYTREELVGNMTWLDFVRDDVKPYLRETHRLRRSQPGKAPASLELELRGKDDRKVHAFVTVAMIPGTTKSVMSVIDITALKQAEERIRHNALHDTVTGLPNRALFLDRVEHTMRLSRHDHVHRYAVLSLDVDRFKLINDSLGHNTGDQFLVRIAQRLKAALNDWDTLARLGGDEFAVLIEGDDSHDEALRHVDRITEALKEPIAVNGHEAFFTVSVGVVLSDEHYDSAEHILRDADTAMFRAKEKGRAEHVVFDADMHQQAVTTMRMESDLRRALERGEFNLVYQPIVRSADLALAGFETLIRWKHPDRGPVSPLEFIPVAEEAGLIPEIGQWVLEQALEDAAAMLVRAPRGRTADDFCLCVNVTVGQLEREDLPGRIGAMLARHGIEGRRLKLEITESMLMQSTYSVIPVLESLKRQGVRLAIDDFGTGYSSLSYLHYLPADTLKVDRTFIKDLDKKEAREARIVGTILSLAENLDMDAVAEGVETKAQFEAVRAMRCRYVQGYYFARPMDLAEALALMDKPQPFQA